MSDDHIEELLTAITEDFTAAELNDDALMKEELRFLLGMSDIEIEILLFGARQIKALRGDRMPLWAQGLQNH